MQELGIRIKNLRPDSYLLNHYLEMQDGMGTA